MATIDSLLNYQDELSTRIFKARVNFRKSPKERITLTYIESRLESLEELWSEFRQSHKNLVHKSDPKVLNKESYVTEQIYDKTEEEFIDYKCELKSSITKYKGPSTLGSGIGNSTKSNQIKLPKICIPNFSGKYTEWVTFRDLFISMIHNNTDLDNVQRLQYLKGYLTGEAEQLIRYIPVSEANYTQCWKIIEERYSNKKYLSHCILTRLLGQRNATTESAAFLKELIDTSSDCLSALGNLDIDVTTWDIIVIHLLSLKLDSESRKQWELNVTTSVSSDSLPTFTQFKEFITSRYRALEYIESKHVNRPSTSYARTYSGQNVSHTKVLHTTDVTKIKCEFCSEEHKLCFCKQFANQDLEQRREFVTNNKICFNCLGSNHGVRFCQTPMNCKICKKRHHTLLHPRSVSTVARVSDEGSGLKPMSSEYDEATTQEHPMVACCAKTPVRNQVLLATALINAEDSTGQYSVIRALLDQGSQASFITEATVQRLGLKKVHIDSVISGLGSDTSIVAKYMVVLKIGSRVDPTFSMELKAYVLNNITTYLPGKKIPLVSWVELQQLCLADPAYDIPNQIDVLLGAEIYCQILKEGLLKGTLGSPVAQCTALGWIISGSVSSTTYHEIISDVARLFDPLGWIAPCVIKAKIFIQRLWIAGTGWDEEPPNDLLQDWYTYREELKLLCEFRIPRWLNTNLEDAVVELHGFSDASNAAYACATYLRVIDITGTVHVSLVAAKTRVSPVKQISIPRLELCGAVLLAKLLLEVAEVLNIPKNCIRAWTDSTVVLAWLDKHASNWKTFVANRVSEIQSTLESSQWSHVSTKDNPADCASRGVRSIDFMHNDMWRFGPSFLRSKEVTYTKLKNNGTREEESVTVHVSAVDTSILEKYSSLSKLVRVVAYCRRFITKRNSPLDTNRTFQGRYLNTHELDDALKTCVRLCQATEFKQEIRELQIHGQVQSKQSKLLSLTPFLDEKGLLRSRGRISKSLESDNAKHPILLPPQSALTKLIVNEAHQKTLHGDVQLMLNYLRSTYWIIGAKNLVKFHVRHCMTCIRYKAKIQTQLMGSLPSVRVTPARVFINSGVDYAGPIMLRTAKGRGHKAYKGYVCLFVCMVTKAVHIEVVSDLTSRGFLEAFKRFVARRGHCANLYSDNGTNFIASSKELKDMLNAEKSTMVQEVADSLAMQGTTWHFMPARAPNFGGLWEAGIKSTKFHIKRVIGETTLTFEEMTTLLNQIEACLNSRPLSIVQNDSGDFNPLTPGHFLIGEPLLTVPEANYQSCNISSLKRWQMTQVMLQNFWKRWSTEYLVHLMHRYKWAYKIPEPQIGDIVLVREDDLPPSRWVFGRILAKYPGSDGLTRVVSLKCKNSTIKRPTSKLCILPLAE